MTFQVTASVPVTPDVEANIANDAFFPDIIVTTARDLVRLDGTITPARLREGLIEAITSVNDELNTYKLKQLEAGYLTLEDVPTSNIDGINRNIHRYNRAVFCLTKANLIERYRDYDSSGEGNKRADELEPTAGDFRRDYRWAISDLLGIGRTTIELI